MSGSINQEESYYFELLSSFGLTKHMGDLEAAKELVRLCHIDRDSRVLEAGRGVGITSCYLAKEVGCKVVAIDVYSEMLRRAMERIRRKGVMGRIEPVAADAQELPFMDNSFDAVICESVLVFIMDKHRAINEFKRVLKPGGYVGFNEVTWIEDSPREQVEYLSTALDGARFLAPEEWRSLLEESGFSDIIVRIYRTSACRQWLSEVKEIDIRDFASAWGRFLLLLFESREVRQYVKKVSRPPKAVFRLFKYFGYGLYIGRK